VEANRLLDVIEQQLDDGLVGIAIAVVDDDAVRWSGASGRLDVDRPDPVTIRTVFPVQSVSKSIVATALMRWVERGGVGLDDPVNRHLRPLEIANEWEAERPITIRQLLTHTAGLPMSLGWGTSPSLEALVGDEVRTEAEPGTRLIYANWGYDVLGYLLSRLAGTAWDAAVRDAVLDPLAMSATHAATSESRSDAPTGHAVSQFDGTVMRLNPPEWPFEPGPPSGSLTSNVEDLARFLIAHLTESGAGIAPATFADMHRLHAPLGAGGGGMGLGFRVDQRGGRAVGPVPLRLDVGVGVVRAELMDVADTDTRAVAAGGWIRAQFAFEIAGFGAIEMMMRLGLTTPGLVGLVYARHPTGELAIPAALAREGAPIVP
jgi:CubicO group peptidase (beta-lactamase class C family)